MTKLRIWDQEGVKVKKPVRRSGKYKPRPRLNFNIPPPKDINVAQCILQSSWMLARTLQLAMQDGESPLDPMAERAELHEMAEQLLRGAAEMDETPRAVSLEEMRIWMDPQETEEWLPGLLPERAMEERIQDEQEELEELEAQLWEALLEQDEKEHVPESSMYFRILVSRV
jgi:hypothetical protein